jgi:hypothetical protein
MAKSLETLLAQLNTLYPHRSKISDGGIGDAAHATRTSDHNPWYRAETGTGIVTARDFTHDPDGGINCNALATWLVNSRDRRIKYVIWNRRIWTASSVKWVEYHGTNPHTNHLHLSVVASVLCDDTRLWKLSTATEDDDMPNLNELLSTKLGKDANTALDAYKDKPGTFGHWLLNQQQDADAARTYGERIDKKLDHVIETLRRMA